MGRTLLRPISIRATVLHDETHGRDPGALSLGSLALQAVVLGAVAARWLLRLGAPPFLEKPLACPLGYHYLAYLHYWYSWAQLSFSYVLHGIECVVLLAAYH